MAKGKQNESRSTTSNSNQPINWCNIRIDAHHLQELDAWNVSDAELLGELGVLAGVGYSITFKFDVGSNSYMVTFICRNDDLPNYGCGLSAWAPDIRDAFRAILFKHYTIANGVWPRSSQNQQSGIR